jgi:hypothetical protein
MLLRILNEMLKFQARVLALIFAVTLACVSSAAQNPAGPQPKRPRTPADYQTTTLQEIAAEELEVSESQKSERVIVHGDLRPSRVRATYRGRVRALPPAKAEVVKRWARLYAGAPEHYNRPYRSEVLFSEKGINYWLVFRTDSLPELKRDLKKGSAVDLFLIRMGATNDGARSAPLLLVESYQKID